MKIEQEMVDNDKEWSMRIQNDRDKELLFVDKK